MAHEALHKKRHIHVVIDLSGELGRLIVIQIALNIVMFIATMAISTVDPAQLTEVDLCLSVCGTVCLCYSW